MGKYAESSRTISVKVVYYGPPHAGKSTNLHRIQQVFDDALTPTEVPLDASGRTALLVTGAPVPLQLPEPCYLKVEAWTIPGESEDDASQRAILQDADGVVFVADARRERLRANLVAYADFLGHLRAMGSDLHGMPIVLQVNKVDQPDCMPPGDLEAAVNSEGFPAFEAAAQTGRGVGKCFTELVRRVMARAHGELALERHGIPRGALASAVDAALVDLANQGRPAEAEAPVPADAGKDEAADLAAAAALSARVAAEMRGEHVVEPLEPAPHQVIGEATPPSAEQLVQTCRKLNQHRLRLEQRLEQLEAALDQLRTQLRRPSEYLVQLLAHLSSLPQLDATQSEAVRGGHEAARFLVSLANPAAPAPTATDVPARHSPAQPVAPY